MRKFSVLFLLVVVALGLAGCDWFRQKPDVVAEVGETSLTLAELRATVAPGEKLSRKEWADRVQQWIDREVLYREALARGLDKRPDVAELLAIAERKILVDQIHRQIDSAMGDVTDGEMTQYYEAHQDMFRRDRDVWTVGKVVFPNMNLANEYVKGWSPVQSEGLIAGKPGILPDGASFSIEVAGPMSDTCWSRDVRRFQRKQLSDPRVCNGSVQSFMLVDRLDSGGVLTFLEVRSMLPDLVREEKRARKLEQMIVDGKSRHPVFSYPEALDSLAPKN